MRRAAPRRSSAPGLAASGKGGRGEGGAQKKTGATEPAFVRMMFCEDEDGLGFAGCENETGVVVVVVADIIVVVRGGRSGD